MGTYVITGASSGIGAALAASLSADGHEVIGVDLTGSTIDADLSTTAGRAAAVSAVLDRADTIDGVVPCAGMAGLPGRDGGAIVALNFFGAVDFVTGLADALAAAAGAVVMISSHSFTYLASMCDAATVRSCLEGDEEAATEQARAIGGPAAYPTSKLAIARWVRREAVTERWIGRGIRLNAIAPGVTETAMVAEARNDPNVGDQMDLLPIPTGQPATPAQVAEVIRFLLGPGGATFCGSVVFADSGTDALLTPDRL